MKRCLSVVLLGTLVVSFLGRVQAQQTGVAGLHDLLPKDVIGYVHLHDIQKTAEQVREAAMKYLPAGEAGKFDSQIKQVMALLAMEAMSAGIDLNKALGEVKDIHFALLDLRDPGKPLGPPPFILAVETKSDGFMDSLFQAIAKQMPPMKQSDHKGVKLTKWFEDKGTKFTLFSTVIGRTGILSGSEGVLKKMIEARTGKVENPLGDSGLLIKARSMKVEGKQMMFPRRTAYGFLDVGLMLASIKKGMNDKEKKEFDATDAIFELSKIKALTWTSAVEGDIATCEAEVTFASESEFYKAIRQEPGELKSLRFIPEDAIMVGVGRLPDPVKTWKRLRDFLAGREDAMGAKVADVEKDFTKFLGVAPEEFAKVVGTEAAFFMLPAMFRVERKTEQGMVREEGFVCGFYIEVKDVKKGEEILKVLAERGVPFEGLKKTEKKENYKGVDVYVAGDPEAMGAYAVLDHGMVIANTPEGVKKTIDAVKEGKSIAKSPVHSRLNKSAVSSTPKSIYLDVDGYLTAMLAEFRKERREALTEMTVIAVIGTGLQTVVSTVEDEGKLRLVTTTSGPFSWAFSAVPCGGWFLSFLATTAPVTAAEPDPIKEAIKPPPPPPPPARKKKK